MSRKLAGIDVGMASGLEVPSAAPMIPWMQLEVAYEIVPLGAVKAVGGNAVDMWGGTWLWQDRPMPVLMLDAVGLAGDRPLLVIFLLLVWRSML